ncbi:hypothetical protein E3O06_10605 [Cryobacterium glaciale]|uniref:M20/M25/M40 family metallo-hydrolase n=1 Tax=Cryobacterium glaciale TaxID=1259145 RepID=A0A4R8UY60_9MICO|nr:hypothetical protein [Cryobacterium glaciale]TFB72746.1 hypothetical protein E3O06_10605 [Cryobacterium glaciale]
MLTTRQDSESLRAGPVTRLDDVYGQIDSGFAAALEELAYLDSIVCGGVSPTYDLAFCAQVVQHSMCTSGLRTHLVEGYGPPAVYGERLVDPNQPTVLIYGRGTCDNKRRHLAQLWALRATLAAHGELPVNVKVLFMGEVVLGSPHLDLVRHHQDLLTADLAITSDGYGCGSGTPQLVLGALDSPFAAILAGAVQQATGVESFVAPSLGSSLPNYVFTDILGIPSVLVPYANADQNNHAAKENFELSRFKDGMRICATILDHVGRAGIPSD